MILALYYQLTGNSHKNPIIKIALLNVDPPGLEPDVKAKSLNHKVLSLQAHQRKNSRKAVSLLTHLGSNQDSAEPKSDVLPITPWVRVCKRDAKLQFIF
jgi:hypothetical protein